MRAIVTAVVLATALITGCAGQDPCRSLLPPTAVELAAAESGADIEREAGSTECDLIDGVWVRDTGSSSLKATKARSTTKATTKARATVRATARARP